MFKLIIILALATVAFSAHDTSNPQWSNIGNECREQLHLTEADLGIITSKMKKESKAAPEHKCFFKCYLEKLHLIDENGVYTPDNCIDYIISHETDPASAIDNKAKLKEEFMQCAPSEKEDVCEKSLEIMQCLADNVVGG